MSGIPWRACVATARVWTRSSTSSSSMHRYSTRRPSSPWPPSVSPPRSHSPISPLTLSLTLTRNYASASPFPTARRASLLRPLNILLFIVPFFTFGLGVWQVKRLRWKVALIEEIQSNIERQPIVLPPYINLAALPDFAFRRVLLKGKFLGPPILQGPVVEQGAPGYNLILPFSRASEGGSTILLNRGFITSTRATAIRRGREIPPGLSGGAGDAGGDGEVVVEGMLSKKFDAGQGRWAPDNVPEENQWFWKDLQGMVAWCKTQKGTEVQPVLVDAIDRGGSPATLLMQQGIPVGKPPTIELRNQHATYAITWFSLSFATAGMLIYVLRKGSGARKLPRTVRPI